MNRSIHLQNSLRSLSLAAVAATLALASVACSAAPDGDPSQEPASTTANHDQGGDDAGANPPSTQQWIPVGPREPLPSPGGGPRTPPHPPLQQ